MQNVMTDYVLNPGFGTRVAQVVMGYKRRVMQRAASQRRKASRS